MDTKQVIIYAAVAAVLGLRIYQKYYKKDKAGQPGRSKQNELTSQSDDYEPYSKK